MPTIEVDDSLKYFYIDSGPPQGVADYHTLIMLHGHSFHSGTFQRLLPTASLKNMRIICINRREYPGTTPFTEEENRIIVSGSDEERYFLLQQQGVGLTQFVCGVIQQCSIPAPIPLKEGTGTKVTKKGGITVAGWSLGNIYMLSMVACIDVVEGEARKKLQEYVTGFFMWDPPCQALGAPEPPKSYLPLWDQSLAPEDRRPVFGKWVSSYFKHGTSPTHDLDSLLYRWECDPNKKSTIETMSKDELASMLAVTAGDHSETRMLDRDYLPVTNKQMMKALFDKEVRKLWPNAGFYLLYGDESVWNVIYGAWYIEDKIKDISGKNEGDLKITSRVQEGANHFPMWEIPEETWDAIIDCINA